MIREERIPLADLTEDQLEALYVHIDSLTNTPVLRTCLVPGCLRQFDAMATMAGSPMRPEWSGQGWCTLGAGSIFPAGGHICPDHKDLVTSHWPRRLKLPSGRWSVACPCGWSPVPQRWHRLVAALWEQHLLTEAGALPAAPPVTDPEHRLPLAEHTEESLAELYDRLWDAEADVPELRSLARAYSVGYSLTVPASSERRPPSKASAPTSPLTPATGPPTSWIPCSGPSSSAGTARTPTPTTSTTTSTVPATRPCGPSPTSTTSPPTRSCRPASTAGGSPTPSRPPSRSRATTSSRRISNRRRAPASPCPACRDGGDLSRCYGHESPGDGLARALRLLATADGHLDPAEWIVTGPLLQVVAINPRRVTPFKGRYAFPRSTRAAKLSRSRLLDVVRIDRGQLRPVDRAHNQTSKVVARACQTLIWERTHTFHRLRRLACGLPRRPPDPSSLSGAVSTRQPPPLRETARERLGTLTHYD